MISFVWSPGERLPAGTGGSENFTVGHVRELNRRGIEARVVTIGVGTADGRDEFDDIPFHSVPALDAVGRLDDTLVFVSEAPPTTTVHPAYQILHVPPPLRQHAHASVVAGTRDRTLVATSRYAAALWADFLDVGLDTIHVVYPFAEPEFATRPRTERTDEVTRVLYAGRLTPEKGIYTLLSALHTDLFDPGSVSVTVTSAGADKPQGAIIERLLRSHPDIALVPARRTPADMASLLVEHDVVVMPSNAQYWHETFGILSIEAQHAGCRVVASRDGGLPETDCGALVLVEPDDAEALAQGILTARRLGPVLQHERMDAGRDFTVADSVDDPAGGHRGRDGADPLGGHPGARGARWRSRPRTSRTAVRASSPQPFGPRPSARRCPYEQWGHHDRPGTRDPTGVDAHAKPEGNATDLLYLEDAVAALAPIMAVCAGAARSSRPDVRALARDALSVQTDRFGAISAVLLGWGRPEKVSPPIAGPKALDGLDGEALDQLFMDRLTAHTHASLIRSRAEMVAGASRSTRSLAEDAIHADDRELASLRALLVVPAQQAGAPVVHDSMSRWSDDGGSWQRPSPVTAPSPTGR